VSAKVDVAFAKDISTLSPRYYTVRRGDSMSVIAKKHKMPLNVLVQLNPKVNARKLRPGQVLITSRGGLGS
jgi:LysM repeat protein